MEVVKDFYGLINMRLILIFITLLAFSNSYKFEEFYMGLIEGFEADPKIYVDCGDNLVLLGDKFSSVITSLDSYLEETPEALEFLIQSTQFFLQTYNITHSKCDFKGIINSLLQFLTPQGQNSIFQNYLQHMAQINSLSLNIKNCKVNFKQCGSNIGTMLKFLTGSNLNSKLRIALMSGENNPWDFIKGFLSIYILKFAKTPLCSGDVFRLIPSFDKLFKEFTIGIGMYDYLMMSVEYTVLKTCWKTEWESEYDFTKVIEYFSIAFDIKAWKLSYFMNNGEINSYLYQISHCYEDYFICGQALPSILDLNEGWVHYQ